MRTAASSSISRTVTALGMLRLHCRREFDREFRAALFAVRCNERATELTHDAHRDRQSEPQSRPRLLGRDERLEDSRQQGRRNAGTGIAHGDGDAAGTLADMHVELAYRH